MKAIDCHFHLDQRLMSVEEMLSRMDLNGIEKAALMACMNEPLPEMPSPVIKFVRFCLTHNLTKIIGRHFVENFSDNGNISLLGSEYEIYQRPDNREVFAAVDRYPERFLGWAFIRPGSTNDQVAELERWINHPGFIGVKAHPFWHRYDPVRLQPAAEILEKTGKPLLMHTGYDSHGDFMKLLDKTPHLKLILAHAGFPGFRTTWKQIKEIDNIYVDLSQPYYVSDRIIRKAVQYLGTDRCCFGTDGPYGFHAEDNKYDYSYVKKRIEKLFPDSQIREKILAANFVKIIDED